MSASNGHTPIEQLRERHERADLEWRALRKERAISRLAPRPGPRRLLEHAGPGFDSAGWLGGWLDLFDRFRQWPGSSVLVAGAADFWDRRYGNYWPFYRTETELALYRQPARVLAGSNSATIGLLYGTSHYLGCSQYKVNSRRGRKAPPELIAAAQAVVDAFTTAAAYAGGEKPGLEHEAFWSFAVDGEFIACLEHDGYGVTRLRDVWPEQLTQPPATDAREWGYGIYAEPDDPGTPLGYNVRWGDDPEYDRAEYEPEDVLHWRNNVPRTVKRGLTDFKFDPYTCLQLSGKLREALGEASVQQAGIVGVRQHAGISAQQIGDFAAARTSYRVRDPFTGATSGVEQRRPGRWEDWGDNSTYTDGPSAGNVPNHVQVLSECHRAGGRRYSAPDWLVSGDTSAANFATSLTAESPFVRAVLEVGRQRGCVLALGAWRALENRCRAGRLVVNGVRVRWEEVRALLEVTATPPTPQTRNKLEEANRDKLYLGDMALKSPQQIAEEQGWDFEKMKEERKAAGLDKPPPPQLPPGAPPGEPPGQPPGNGGPPAPPAGTNGPPQRTSDADRPDADAAPQAVAEQALLECGGEGGKPGPCPAGGNKADRHAEREKARAERKAAYRAAARGHRKALYAATRGAIARAGNALDGMPLEREVGALPEADRLVLGGRDVLRQAHARLAGLTHDPARSRGEKARAWSAFARRLRGEARRVARHRDGLPADAAGAPGRRHTADRALSGLRTAARHAEATAARIATAKVKPVPRPTKGTPA